MGDGTVKPVFGDEMRHGNELQQRSATSPEIPYET